MAKKQIKKAIISVGPLTSTGKVIAAISPINNHGLGIKPLITMDPNKKEEK